MIRRLILMLLMFMMMLLRLAGCCLEVGRGIFREIEDNKDTIKEEIHEIWDGFQEEAKEWEW